jgi:L-ascorbate metabolism protein UlaG (beta-lactamase superfamily)
MKITAAVLACALALDVATRNPRTGAQASDVFPFFTPDGRVMYFVRDFTAFHRVPKERVLASVRDTASIRYVANSGMLVQLGSRRFLLDAPIRDGIAPYATSAADERRRLEAALAPYDRIDAILVTHWHEDHFSAEAVAAHLAHDARTVVVSSPEVIERVRRAAPDLPAARLRAVLPAAGASEAITVAGVPIHVLRVRHNPARRLPEQHVGFLIGDAAPVLHVGDADPVADNFRALQELPAPDVALLPFWYVTGASNRAMVHSAIRPRRVVAMHAPPADAATIAPELDGAPFPIVLAHEPGRELALAR